MPNIYVWGPGDSSLNGMSTELTGFKSTGLGNIRNGRLAVARPVSSVDNSLNHIAASRRIQGPQIAMGDGNHELDTAVMPITLDLIKDWLPSFALYVDIYLLMSTDDIEVNETVVQAYTSEGGWTSTVLIPPTPQSGITYAQWLVIPQVLYGVGDDPYMGLETESLMLKFDSTLSSGSNYLYGVKLIYPGEDTITV